MNELRRPELTQAIFGVAAPFAQASSDAARRFCEQGQTVATTVTEWTSEMSQFLSHRTARNNEAISRMMKCQNLPEAFATQSQWVQDAADDYLKEMTKLMEFNSRIMGGLIGSNAKVETRPSSETQSLPAKVPMRTAS